MKKMTFAIVLIIVGVISLFAQTDSSILDLNDALKSNQVELDVHGTGGSSGASVKGSLRNLTLHEVRINIYIDGGIYLDNSGSGQNMLGTQIYLEGGRYYSLGSQDYIILDPNQTSEIFLWAFCANLDYKNPSTSERFSTGNMPSDIRNIASKINRYEREHPDEENIITIAQVALWRAQGKTAREITRYYDFSLEDWNKAGIILNY